MAMAKMAVTEDVMVESMDMSYVDTAVGMDDGYDMGNTENTNSAISTHVILYIVIGVCAVIGIVLGIVLGRRAAYK